ncbi:MAG: 3-keto-5-aminohexanoate cleavage protein, partial [Anaerolineales bacterium]|nr:3-keto-5-aminohexanoate cleavage protein [Anaerolineales bacterium]
KETIWDFCNSYEWINRVRGSSFPPLIVCCATTGGIHGKESNPNLPEMPEEQVEQTQAVYEAGASMVHLHARHPERWWDGADTVELYRNLNAMIRDACPDIIINNTTGGSLGMTVEQRLSCLDAGPEVATLNMGPPMYKYKLKERKAPLLHPQPEKNTSGISPITYDEIRRFAKAMQQRGIKQEMEVYHAGQLWAAFDIIEQGFVKPPYLVQFVMGYVTSPYATPRNLLNLVDNLPSQSLLEVSGLGPYQLPMTTMALVLGAQVVRVGMEDNVYYKRGQLLESNVEAVARLVRIANELNREIATPAQAREILGLSSIPSSY